MLKPAFTYNIKSRFFVLVTMALGTCIMLIPFRGVCASGEFRLLITDIRMPVALVFVAVLLVFIGFGLSFFFRRYRVLLRRYEELASENRRLVQEISNLGNIESFRSANGSNVVLRELNNLPDLGTSGNDSGSLPEESNFEKGDIYLNGGASANNSAAIGEVSHVWVQGNYIHYKYKDSSKFEMQRDSLKNVYVRLQQYNFVQTHKSYLVNMAMVKQIRSQEVTLEDGSKVPVSRKYREAFRAEYMRYKGNGL